MDSGIVSFRKTSKSACHEPITVNASPKKGTFCCPIWGKQSRACAVSRPREMSDLDSLRRCQAFTFAWRSRSSAVLVVRTFEHCHRFLPFLYVPSSVANFPNKFVPVRPQQAPVFASEMMAILPLRKPPFRLGLIEAAIRLEDVASNRELAGALAADYSICLETSVVDTASFRTSFKAGCPATPKLLKC